MSESLDNRGNSAKVRMTVCKLDNSAGAQVMKNVYEVLRQKEMELTRLEKEVEALRVVAPLLSEENMKESVSEVKSVLPTAVNAAQPTRMAVSAPPISAPQPVRAAGWEDTAKRWP